MADDHHSLRVPTWLWKERYAEVVGKLGRTDDLKAFMDWQVDNPDQVLGEDVEQPYDFLATFRVETTRWDLFVAAIGDENLSSRLRAYIWWRAQNPDEPLPGRRMPPIRRHGQTLACV